MSQETTYFICSDQQLDQLLEGWIDGEPDYTTAPTEGPDLPEFSKLDLDHATLYNFGSPHIENLLAVASDESSVEELHTIAVHPSFEAHVSALPDDLVENLADFKDLDELVRGFVGSDVAPTTEQLQTPIRALHGIARRATDSGLSMYLLWCL